MSAIAPVAKGLGTLKGWVGANRVRVYGFAVELASPAECVRLIVEIDGKEVARIVADRHHDGPALTRLSSGQIHGFHLAYSPLDPSVPHTIAVRREDDGVHVPSSPALLDAGFTFNRATLLELARMFDAVSDPAEMSSCIEFLEERIASLRSRNHDHINPREGRDALRNLRTEIGPAFDDVIAREYAQLARPRLLIICDSLPGRDHPAGRLIRGQVELLCALGWDASLAAAAALENPRQVEAVAAELGVHPLAMPMNYSIEDILKRQRRGFDAVYFADVLSATRYLQLARAYQPSAFVALVVPRLEHLMLEQLADVAVQPELRTASRRVRFLETTAVRMADCIITATPREARALAALLPGGNFRAIAAPAMPPAAAPWRERSAIGFIGSFADQADRDAAIWLINDIMPAVWRRAPEILCHVAGPGWSADAIPDRDPRIVLHDGAGGLMENLRLTVAPHRVACGMAWHAIDSLAGGIPCVMSQVVAAGLPRHEMLATSSELRGLIAPDTESFARAILRLHADMDSNLAAGAAGSLLVQATLGAGMIRAQLAAAFPRPA